MPIKIRSVLTLFLVPLCVQCADIQWSRLRGTVRAIDHKASKLTIQNSEGDLFTIPVTADVHIAEGKTDSQLALKDLHLDEKVTLTLIPEADKPKDETFEQMNAK